MPECSGRLVSLAQAAALMRDPRRTPESTSRPSGACGHPSMISDASDVKPSADASCPTVAAGWCTVTSTMRSRSGSLGSVTATRSRPRPDVDADVDVDPVVVMPEEWGSGRRNRNDRTISLGPC